MYHQRFAGNCFEAPSTACFTQGLGPDAYDCSGLIIGSVTAVLGMQIRHWPPSVRHVRDMWRNADQLGAVAPVADVAVGGLVVFRRQYDIEGRRLEVPGHIGVVSDVLDGAIDVIHANPRKRTVEERRVDISADMLGCIVVQEGGLFGGLLY